GNRNWYINYGNGAGQFGGQTVWQWPQLPDNANIFTGNFNGAEPSAPPNTPSNLQASDGTYTDKVRVTWSAVNVAASYIVYRNTSNSSSGRIQLGTTSTTIYDDTSAQSGQTYYYWVRAQNNAGASDYSSSDSGYRANPTSTGVVLNVRYVDQVYVQQTSANGYWILCGPSSASMLLHYKGLEARDVFTDRQATRDLCGMMNQYGTGTCYSGRTWHGPMINILRNRGLNIFAKYSTPTFEEIKQSIDRNSPIIMGLNIGHIVLVVGYDNTNQQVIIHDPFGRKVWWGEPQNWWQGATNMPPSGLPKTVGANVVYTYQELRPLISSTFFVQGALSPAAATTANWHDTIESGNVSIQLGDFLTHAAFGDIQQATFSPLLTPSTNVEDYHGTWESFILSAIDSYGQPVHISSEPFTVDVTFDKEWLQGLRLESGIVSESGLQQLPNTQVKATVIYWDSTTETWLEIASNVDLDAGIISFEGYKFGEYALAFIVNNQLYLPVVIR
ncbi:MAG: C39 family peptidase, partial [Anaerolineales bacterium]|nr:C39 family peptidase [Anaerolineales bacterium]